MGYRFNNVKFVKRRIFYFYFKVFLWQPILRPPGLCRLGKE